MPARWEKNHEGKIRNKNGASSRALSGEQTLPGMKGGPEEEKTPAPAQQPPEDQATGPQPPSVAGTMGSLLPRPQADQKMEVANPAEFGFDFRENFDGGAMPRLPQIGIVSTAQMFKCGDDKFDSFSGTILHYQLCNAWWEKSIEDGSGNVPDCASNNGIVPDSGDKRQCESCDKCPMNAYGSDPKDGRGKWCKNMMRLHILKDDDVIPSRLTIPATSLRAADEFFTGLFNKKIAYQIAKVAFSLAPAKNKTNIEYSRIQFEVLGTLQTRDEMLMVKRYIDQFKVSFGDKIMADEHAPAKEASEKDGIGY